MADQNAPTGASEPRTVEDVERAVRAFQDDYKAVRQQVTRIIVGHDEIVDGVLTCLFAGGHALLEGVPGLGKTLLIRSLAGALRLKFGRVQFTPDLMPADVTGTTIVADTPEGRRFVFQRGPVFANILLADEINRATPKTQSALLEAMQERSVTVGGETHMLDRPFFVMATQNPVEQEGTYPLPEAQLDRFFFKLLLSFSSREELAEVLRRTTGGDAPEVKPVLDAAKILEHQSMVRRVRVAEHVQDYAVRLTLATHPRNEGGIASRHESFAPPMVEKFVRYGASPRAAQTLILGGKVRAMLDGRTALSIDDVKAIALPALRHRVLLNFEGEAEGVTTDQIIENIAATLPTQVAV